MRTAVNAKIPVYVICVEAIIYLLLFNLHDCTFKLNIFVNLSNPLCDYRKMFIISVTLSSEILN